ESHGLDGISFTVSYGGASERVESKLIGKHSVYHALAAIAVMLTLGYPLAEAAAALAASPIESLRLRVLPGKGGVTVIDDSYNSSPIAARAALQLLSELGRGKHVAVLGDMRELGQYSAGLHREVGASAVPLCQLLVTVGEEALQMAEGARAAGMPEDRLLATTEPQEAIDFLRPRLSVGDYLLIKGSRAMGLENIVKEFTA
ncbi:MAG TPA: cyanophycin synthetase, partial [Chloroflexota bacterium]|nr:cyanophycin synthetase [Chloroflexota bacterium]